MAPPVPGPAAPTLGFAEPVAASALPVAGARVLVGASSWADASLTQEGGWYPRRAMKAPERMAYYATRLPVVEIPSTYRFPPTPELARSWAERTPPGFTVDVRAWSLLTGQPTLPGSLWADLWAEVRPELRDRRRLYDKNLPRSVVDEAFARFRHALAPLHEADRLGAVLLAYPPWFGPKEAHAEVVVAAAERLAPLPLAVELQCPKWLEPRQCEPTLTFLEDHGLAFVCTDEPQGGGDAGSPAAPPVVAATAELAVVRLSGRFERHEGPSGTHWRRLRYGDDDLAAWASRVRDLASGVAEVHVVVDTPHRDWGVTAAERLVGMLSGEEGDRAEEDRRP